jgi:hypothetical protein
VITHELGHLLGYDDHDGGNDIMTTSLDVGVRRKVASTLQSDTPEALSTDFGTGDSNSMSYGASEGVQHVNHNQVHLTSLKDGHKHRR